MTKSAAEMLFAAKAIDDIALFAALFSPLELHAAFESKFASSTGKGTDRLNGFQFATRAAYELSIASAKCLSGQYRFAPFMETLKIKQLFFCKFRELVLGCCAYAPNQGFMVR